MSIKYIDDDIFDIYIMKDKIQNIDLENLVNDIQIEVEHKTDDKGSSIDILLHSKNASFVCIIENKS